MEHRHTPEEGAQRDDLIEQVKAHALNISRAFFDPGNKFELDNMVHFAVMSREAHYFSEKVGALLVCLIEDVADKVSETGSFEPKRDAWSGVSWDANSLFKEAGLDKKREG